MRKRVIIACANGALGGKRDAVTLPYFRETLLLLRVLELPIRVHGIKNGHGFLQQQWGNMFKIASVMTDIEVVFSLWDKGRIIIINDIRAIAHFR